MSTLIAAAADASEYAARFQTDGVLVVDPLVDAATVDSLKHRTAEIAAARASSSGKHLRYVDN